MFRNKTSRRALRVDRFLIVLRTLALSCVLLCVNNTWAETLLPALGARSAGRGGTNFAFSDNGFVLHDNPAGLIGATKCECGETQDILEVSVGMLFPDLKYSDPQNPGLSASNDLFGLGALTFGHRINDDLAFGLGVYTPAGFGARWTMEGPPGPLAGPQFYKSIGMLVRILPGVSYQATERLRIGGTLGVAASHVELEGPYFINSSPLAGTPTKIDIQATGTAITWSTGLQYDLTEQLTVAARYQSQNRFKNDGNALVMIPGLGTSAYDMILDIVWPRSLGFGLQYKLTESRRIGLDLDWQQWSRATDKIDLAFRNPSNPVFQAVAGPTLNDSIPLAWSDTIVVKTGLEQDIGTDKTLRVGYSYNNDAAQSGSMTPYIPTILSHYFTGGFGLKRNGWEYDAAYQYAFRPTMRVATSDLAGGDFSSSSFHTAAHFMFLSATRKF